MNTQIEIEELKAKLKELEKQVEIQEKIKKQKKFIPNSFDEYYYIDSFGKVLVEIYGSSSADDYRVSINNCYRTREEALKHKRILTNTQKLRDLADRLNNDRLMDWNDNGQAKYFLKFDRLEGIYEDVEYNEKLQGTIFCLSKDFVGKAMEKIGEEDLIELIMEG